MNKQEGTETLQISRLGLSPDEVMDNMKAASPKFSLNPMRCKRIGNNMNDCA
jgi:hypothetical protein